MEFQKLKPGTLVKVCYDLKEYIIKNFNKKFVHIIWVENLQKYISDRYGINSKSVLDMNFLYACYNQNLEKINDKTLNKDNIVIPKKETYFVSYVKIEERIVHVTYDYELELYTDESDFLSSIIDTDEFLDSDPWWEKNPDDEEWRDTTNIDTNYHVRKEN